MKVLMTLTVPMRGLLKIKRSFPTNFSSSSSALPLAGVISAYIMVGGSRQAARPVRTYTPR